MNARSKCGLMLAVALLCSAAVATSAQAISITPAGAVNGVAQTDPTLQYGGVQILCQNGTADGTATGDATINDLSVTFQTGCNINGQGASVVCSGTVTLTATVAGAGGSGQGTIDLNPLFSCSVTVPLTCTVTVDGTNQPTQPTNVNTFNASTDILEAEVTVFATRTGSATCGGASGNAVFTGDYLVTPDNLAINP
jgi:hypothetical protein